MFEKDFGDYHRFEVPMLSAGNSRVMDFSMSQLSSSTTVQSLYNEKTDNIDEIVDNTEDNTVSEGSLLKVS